MLVFLIYWFVVISAFTVLGFTADRLFRKLSGAVRENYQTTPDLWFIAGLIISSVFTGWLSVVLPIDRYIVAGYLLLVFLLIIIQSRSLSEELKFWLRRWKKFNPSLWVQALYVLGIVLLAVSLSSQGIQVYDTGLYHTQSIEWIQQYAVVPGLGNLHARFAFNSMFFPLQALFESNFNGQPTYPLVGAVLIVVAGRLLYETANAAKSKKWNQAIFFSFLITTVVVTHMSQFSSPSTDLVGALSVVYLAAFVVVNPRNYLNKGFESWVLIGLLLLLPTFKLSNAVMIVFLLPLLRHIIAGRLLSAVGLGVVIVAPFVIRNYFLSGYFVFPSAAIDLFSPDWKVPIETVEVVQKVIQSWAILPAVDAQEVQDMRVMDWLPKWFLMYSVAHKFILLLNVLSFILWIIAIFVRQQRELLLVHAAVILNIVFWFISAPDMRMAMGMLIFNAAMIFLYTGNLRLQKLIPYWFRYALLILPFFGWFYLSRFELKESISDSSSFLTPVSGFPSPEIKKHTDPFMHYHPVHNDRCFDAPLPCTPENCEDLKMRGQSPSDGYRMEQSNSE